MFKTRGSAARANGAQNKVRTSPMTALTDLGFMEGMAN
jgi:hypothetical protein